jgi:phytoene dehydrogenase-like protein
MRKLLSMISSPKSTSLPTPASTLPLPQLGDVEAAAERLAGQVVVTPLLHAPALDERVGARVLIKPETLQRRPWTNGSARGC